MPRLHERVALIMKAQDLIARCMAWRQSDGQWVAVCIDYSLAAQGDTLAEAKSRLHSQIESYVRDALTVDAAHADQLLTRKAPAIDLVRYNVWRLLSGCARAIKRAHSMAERLAYVEPLPLVLA